MSTPNNHPPQCLECDKFYRNRIDSRCRVCRDLEFDEGMLCDLNRSVQDSHKFVCHAFRPRLNLVGSDKEPKPTITTPLDRESRHKSIQEIMTSDKFKYQKALALQKLNQDPDEIFGVLKYHLAWNVHQRRAVFAPEKKFFDFILDTVIGCGDLVCGKARLLWLAPDHLHVYIESDGQKSIDTIIRKLKPTLKKEILAGFPEIKQAIFRGTAIWDNAYFVETLG